MHAGGGDLPPLAAPSDAVGVRHMRHTVFWIVVIAAGVLVCGALAAPVVLTSAKVGGGNTSVVACDTDGLTQSYTTSRGNVTAVVVGGIADPACEGGTIRATVK